MTPLAVGTLSQVHYLAGDDTDKAGPLGLLVIVLLGVACYFLFRSMSKHLRRVNGLPVDAYVPRAAPPVASDPSAPRPPAAETDPNAAD